MLVTLVAGTLAAKGLLMVDMLAIARLENGKWKNLVSKPSDPVGKLRNIQFTELGISGTTGKVTIPRLELQSDVAEGWFAIKEEWSNKVLWSGTAPKFPATQVYSPSSKVYLDVVQAHLRAKGLGQAKARINRVVGVDLDGDGVREVVIEAAPLADMVPRTMEDGKPTDYTSILIRCVRNGKAITVVVAHHDARQDGALGGADQLRAIADFDGDGKFEVVGSSDYYEGQSAAVYQFRKGSVRKLVEYGAGV
ncbi:MAG: hypothetical protein H7Y17_05515 [Chlorobia bacterium]|nr:hypothetical protein [Fimbriimonadaceae bacterium]